MQSSIQYFILLLLFSTFVGCGVPTPTPKEVKTPPPSWVYGVPPADSKTKMYGIGIGRDRESAIKTALNSMVSRLSITLKSSFKSREKVEDSYHTSRVINNIEANIAKIKINNYKVIRAYRVNYKEFAVMIESDKKRFIKGLEEDLQERYKDIFEQLRDVKKDTILVRYNREKILNKEAKKLQSSLFIISELDPYFDNRRYLDLILRVKSTFLEEKHNLKFYVEGDDNSKIFVEKIKNNLVKKGFNLSESEKRGIRVVVKTEKRLSNIFVKIITYTIHITVYDGRRQIGGQTTVIKERDTDSQHAQDMAAIAFNESIKKRGITSVLGVEIQ